MTVTVGDILKVVCTLVWTDGNIAQNVFNARIGGSGGPFTDGDIVDDAESWSDTMFANLVAVMTTLIDGSQIQVYKYDAIDDDFDEVGTVGWTFDPTLVAHQLPRGSAGLSTCRTSDADVQGKKYLTGFTENHLTDGLYTVSLLTLILGFADDWVTPFVGGTSGASWVPGIWSPKNSALYDCDDSYTASAIPAYQRRRKRGVGA